MISPALQTPGLEASSAPYAHITAVTTQELQTWHLEHPEISALHVRTRCSETHGVTAGSEDSSPCHAVPVPAGL